MKCAYCERFCKKYNNFCNWDCQINFAKRMGGKQITPNNLPIRCIRYDGTMLECQNGDHKDYKFPVEVENTEDNYSEYHALIYVNETICLTLGDCSYNMFLLAYNECKTNKYLELTLDSLEKIKKYNEQNIQNK